MNRTPGIDVRRTLRKEVGFGCPVPGCGNPYLFYHHFDPPWNVEQHHNPEGMIALCGTHHPMADAGAYTVDQLRTFKEQGQRHAEDVKGRFEWMRRNVLVVAGSIFGYETPTLVEIAGHRAIWLNRDEEGYLLLNVQMLTISNEERVRIDDNMWVTPGNPYDLESPPSGRLLHVKYTNGDMIRVEFADLMSDSDAVQKYPDARPENWNLAYPITTAEVHMTIAGTGIEFGPRDTKIGTNTFKNIFISHCGAGLSIN